MTTRKNNCLRIIILCNLLITVNLLNAQSVFKKLVWADEFNYKGLPDSTKWSYDKGNGCPDVCGWGNNELQYYTSRRLQNARIKNGILIIEAKKENFVTAKYTSARLVSKNKGDWKYARIEVKAKNSCRHWYVARHLDAAYKMGIRGMAA